MVNDKTTYCAVVNDKDIKLNLLTARNTCKREKYQHDALTWCIKTQTHPPRSHIQDQQTEIQVVPPLFVHYICKAKIVLELCTKVRSTLGTIIVVVSISIKSKISISIKSKRSTPGIPISFM